MYIVAFYQDEDGYRNDLDPKVTVWDLADDSIQILSGTMTLVGMGSYKYDFVNYDPQKEYNTVCDAGVDLEPEIRYTQGTNIMNEFDYRRPVVRFDR